MLAVVSSASLGLRHAAMMPMRQAATMPNVNRAAPAVWMAAVEAMAPEAEADRFANLPGFSGLNGKAMLVEKSDIPTKGDVKKAVPAHCFTRNTMRSLKYAAISVLEGAACVALGLQSPQI